MIIPPTRIVVCNDNSRYYSIEVIAVSDLLCLLSSSVHQLDLNVRHVRLGMLVLLSN